MYHTSSNRVKRSSGGSGTRTGFSDTGLSVDSGMGLKSRPNSAPLQTAGLATVPASSGSSSASPSTSAGGGTDSMSLVEQRLRIVKRNRTKGAEGEGAPGGMSGFASVAPRLAAYPVQDTNVLSKQDQCVVEAVTRDVLDTLFFPESASL